jgi:hypothetical protein
MPAAAQGQEKLAFAGANFGSGVAMGEAASVGATGAGADSPAAAGAEDAAVAIGAGDPSVRPRFCASARGTGAALGRRAGGVAVGEGSTMTGLGDGAGSGAGRVGAATG